MNFYTKIYAEKEQALWKITLGIALFVAVTMLLLVVSERGNISDWILFLAVHMVAASIAYSCIFSGCAQLMNAYREFCEHRIIPMGLSLNARYPGITIIVPKRWVFQKSNDLREVEERMCGYLRSDQRREERKIRERKWAAQCNKLRPEFLALAESPGFTDEERRVVLEIGTKFRNSDAMRHFIVKWQTILAHDAFVARITENDSSQPASAEEIQPVVAQENRRLVFLEAQAEDCVSEAARVLYEHALRETDRRARIRLLKEAIHAEQKVNRAETAASSTQSEPETPRAENDVKHVDLSELLEERFHIAHLIPRGVDAAMVKEILVVLLEPGRMQRRFQRAYRLESRIKRRVVNRYNAWVTKPFDPRSFSETLGWLVRVGALRSGYKGEPTYSLSANTKEVTTAEGQALIIAVLRFDREIRHGRMW